MAELTLEFADRQGWREWLIRNHFSDDIVWLVIMKRSVERPWLTYPEALEEAICFGWIDSRMKRIDDSKHVIRFSRRKKFGAWSLKNLRTAKMLIERGDMTPHGLAALPKGLDNVIEAAERKAEDELAIPEDLAVALMAAGLEGMFASMSPSYRRAYFHWITQAKRPETRQRRVEESLSHIAKRELPMDMTRWKGR